MTLSAADLTRPNKQNANYRRRHGFTNLVYGRTFGTAKTTNGVEKAITSVADMWDPNIGGFWPCMEPFLFTCNALAGNWENMRYMNSAGLGQPSNPTLLNGRSRLPRYGEPHVMNANSLSLVTRLHPSVTTTQGLKDTYFRQYPFKTPTTGPVQPLGSSGTMTFDVDLVANPLVGVQYSMAPDYKRNSACVATLVSYTPNVDGVSASATWQKNYVPDGATAGSHNQLHIQALVFDSAMFSTKELISLPPVYHGYWECRVKLPAGKGIWPAWWWIRNNTWPPEIDAIETFREVGTELDTINSGAISAVSGQSWFQRNRTLQNQCVRDGVGLNDRHLSWGYDLTTGFHTVGMEWCGDGYLVNVLDDTAGREQQYKWVVHAPAAASSSLYYPPTQAIAKGDPQAFPHMVFNLAIGPTMDGYRPDDITKFPGEFEIDYVRVYTREIA